MILDHSNTYIKQHGDGYVICIDTPERTRNYIHCEKIPLDTILLIKSDILNQKIGNWNTEIVPDGNYFRINVILKHGLQLSGENDKDLKFHSRLLNLNDAEFEYYQMTGNESR
ncbi:MAG: hypothetical protein KGI08_08635 [Thaumarchaeota archaeon]|nr:hypothetical protein [Nitrososphaerota archaeon]